MPITIGDAECTSGLSSRILQNWKDITLADDSKPLDGLPAVPLKYMKGLAYGVAKGVGDQYALDYSPVFLRAFVGYAQQFLSGAHKPIDYNGFSENVGGGVVTRTVQAGVDNIDWRYTFPRSGRYYVSASALFSALPATGDVLLDIAVVGVYISRHGVLAPTGGSGSTLRGIYADKAVRVTAGQQLSLNLYNGSGATRTLFSNYHDSNLTVTWLGD